MQVVLDSLDLAQAERKLCAHALNQAGTIIEAASLLGITRHALKRRITKHRIAWPPPEGLPERRKPTTKGHDFLAPPMAHSEPMMHRPPHRPAAPAMNQPLQTPPRHHAMPNHYDRRTPMDANNHMRPAPPQHSMPNHLMGRADLPKFER